MKFNNETRKNLLIGALEGGSNYWYWIPDRAVDVMNLYKEFDDTFADKMYRALEKGRSLEVEDIESKDLLGSISLESMEKAEELMLERHPHHFADIITETDDSTTADVWFQLCVMGE